MLHEDVCSDSEGGQRNKPEQDSDTIAFSLPIRRLPGPQISSSAVSSCFPRAGEAKLS